MQRHVCLSGCHLRSFHLSTRPVVVSFSDLRGSWKQSICRDCLRISQPLHPVHLVLLVFACSRSHININRESLDLQGSINRRQLVEHAAARYAIMPFEASMALRACGHLCSGPSGSLLHSKLQQCSNATFNRQLHAAFAAGGNCILLSTATHSVNSGENGSAAVSRCISLPEYAVVCLIVKSDVILRLRQCPS